MGSGVVDTARDGEIADGVKTPAKIGAAGEAGRAPLSFSVAVADAIRAKIEASGDSRAPMTGTDPAAGKECCGGDDGNGDCGSGGGGGGKPVLERKLSCAPRR